MAKRKKKGKSPQGNYLYKVQKDANGMYRIRIRVQQYEKQTLAELCYIILQNCISILFEEDIDISGRIANDEFGITEPITAELLADFLSDLVWLVAEDLDRDLDSIGELSDENIKKELEKYGIYTNIGAEDEDEE